MTTITLANATDLLVRAYDGPSAMPPLKVHKVHRFAQSYLTADDILVVPGMNELMDRIRGLNQFHYQGHSFGWAAHNSAISRSVWLGLFISYAIDVLKITKPHKPRLIIGHSLGSGITQILCQHYRVPGICFSAPAVADKRHLKVDPYETILNVNTPGDWLPGSLHDQGNLRLFGTKRTIPMPPGHSNAHKMTTYHGAVAQGGAGLPPSWPPAGTTARSGGGSGGGGA